MAENRVMVFIDGSNLYKGVKDGLKTDKLVDIEKLAKKLVDGRILERIYFYTTPTPSTDPLAMQANQKFLDKLGWIDNLQVRKGRIMPRTHEFTCNKCNEKQIYKTYIQKGVDTRIVVDMVTLAVNDSYNVAVLVSGDSDLSEALNFIREHTHKKVENACVPDISWAKTLREASDKRISLTLDYLENCFLP